MFDILAEKPDPILYFIVIFPLTLIALFLGYLYAYRYGKLGPDKSGWAFGLAQGAIFGLIALILGFSFRMPRGDLKPAARLSSTKQVRSGPRIFEPASFRPRRLRSSDRFSRSTRRRGCEPMPKFATCAPSPSH